MVMRRGFAARRAALIGATGLLLVFAGTGPDVAKAQGLNASVHVVPISKASAAMRALSPEEQLSRAFAAAFPRSLQAKRQGGAVMAYRPGALAWTSDGAVLVSEGAVSDEGPGGHGVLAVHYLKPEGTAFTVAGANLNAIRGELRGWLSTWVVSTDFGEKPVVVVETFDASGGVACTHTALYELEGAKPTPLGAFQSGYDDTSPKGDDPEAVSLAGSIRNIIWGRSFEVHFDGTSRFKQSFVRKGRTYVRTIADGDLPAC